MIGKVFGLARRIKRKAFKKTVVTGIGTSFPLKALLYYKTDPFVDSTSVTQYEHTNNWEIIEIVRILNHYGFCVDVVDRGAKSFDPEDIYDLFIGIGAGNSGQHFVKYAMKLKRATKIVYAAGPEPTLSNLLVLEQYNRFSNRTGINADPMRVTDKIDFSAISPVMDYVFCTGYRGGFSYQSYVQFGKPVYPISPGTSPTIRFDPIWLKKRERHTFLCFAGNGFICKGVDILVEAFITEPRLNLHICGPDNEAAFFEAYGEKINSSANITYEGFVQVGGERFNALCATCSYVIFYSSSEGCATSVASVMRAGLVPIVNHESGIDVGDFGRLMTGSENRIHDARDNAIWAASLDDVEYERCVAGTLKSSLDYTQAAFTRSFSEALLDVMVREGFLHANHQPISS